LPGAGSDSENLSLSISSLLWARITDIERTFLNRRFVPRHSDVPSQAPRARLIALWLPCWLEGCREWIVQRRGRDLKTSVIKL
jgi:hypothetical protein